MITKLLIIFCAIAHGLAAPRCTDLCGPALNTHTSESLTAFGTHSSLAQQQSSLRELHQSLTDQLQSSRINVDLDRPGNWTDHKDYRTPDGAGQVHEEAGQLVNGGAKVRYYKKNYAASYGSSNNLGSHNLESESLLQDDLLRSRNIGQSTVQNYGHNTYDQQSRLDSSRFQESNTQLHNNRVTGASNDNWSRFNTYGVDGGRGKVYEEEGQYTQGPAKVRYYKKNYTSSYTSSGVPSPSVVPIVDVTDIESQAQQLQSRLNQLSRDFHHSQSIHSDNSAHQSDYGQVYTDNNYSQHYDRPLTTEQRYEHTSRQEHTVKSGGSGYVPVQPVTHFNYVIPDTELESIGSQSQHTGQQTIHTPTHVQTHQTHRTQVDETHHNQRTEDIVRVPLHRVNDYGSNTYRGESMRQETLTEEQARRNQLRDNIQYPYTQPESARIVQTHPGRRVEEHWESNSRHRVESTIPHHIETIPMRDDITHQKISQGGSNQVTHVSGGSSSSYQHHEQFGSSGSYRIGAIDLGHQGADCDTLHEGQLGQYTRRHKRDVEFGQQREHSGGYQYSGYGHQSHEGHPHQDDDRHRHHDRSYEQNSGLGYQQSGYGYQSHEGHPHQDDDRHRHHGQHNQEGRDGYSGYGYQSHEGHPHQDDDRHRYYDQDYSQRQRFRREEYNHEDHDHKSHEGHPHQDDDRHRHLSRDNDWGNYESHDHDHNHQSHEGHPHQDDDRHRHSGQEHRYKRGSQRYEDFDQQSTVGNFDFSQNTEKLGLEKQKLENLNQETQGVNFWHQQAGNLELGQQTEDLSQQTYKFDNFGQQHVGDLEFGQETEDLSQQSHKFDFGQQTEDLSQQTHKFDDFSQHQSGSNEFGHNHHELETGNLEFGQQTEDLSQQTHKFDFGQQTEDLSQQTHKFDDFTQLQSGNHEFGHNHHKLETGNLELGQQTEDLSQQTHKFDFGQQTENLSQQTHKFDDFSQHQSGSHEFDHHHHKLETGNLEFGQQTEDLSQQTHTFDFGQQYQSGTHDFGHNHHKLETGNLEFGQQTEDLSQQTHKFDFGQQTEDLSHQTHKFDDFSQHQSGSHEFGHSHHKLETGNLEFGQQTEDLSQQTHTFDFGQQHQSETHDFGHNHHKLETGNLEFSQQTVDLAHQTHKLDDFSQQQSGTHEFGQHHHQLPTGSLEFGQQTEDLSQQTHKLDDFSQQQSGTHEFGQHHNQLQTGNLEFGQQIHELGQSNSEFDQQNQQTSFNPSTNYPREFKPAPKPTPRPLRVGNQRGDIEPELVIPEGPVSSVKPVSPVRPVKGGRVYPPRVLPAQYRNEVPSSGVLSLEEQALSQGSANSWHQSHHPGDLTSDNLGQQSQVDSVTLQSRILEVYGGKGPYEAGYQEDYSGVKPNPSATLAPQYYGNEPWEIREVASEQFSARSAASLNAVPESTTQLPETTPAPGFWKKLGNKITTSYEKAKEKLSDTFG